MHQTFYIDIDEEITSVIDRLKKAKAEEVVVVIPKRALIIQSLVNLKILRKEAEDLGLKIMAVTQDKLGKMLIENAGILAQDSLDDTLEDNVIYGGEEGGVIKEISQEGIIAEDSGARERIKGIGSAGYFDGRSEQHKKVTVRRGRSIKVNEKVEKLTNRELVGPKEKDGKAVWKEIISGKRKSASLDLRRLEKKDASKDFAKEQEPEEDNFRESKKLETFFKGEGKHSDMYRPKKETKVPSKFWKKFVYFTLILLVVGGVLAVYLFFPKASVNIYTKGKIQAVDAEVKGDASLSQIDYSLGAIPAKIVSIEDEVSGNFDVSGKKSVSNQKASGAVTIYNEYSDNPQVLVATTRLETSDGKIFRLKKTITVPGMTKVDNEMKPGAIEAEVSADDAGDAYNIGPSTFSIPGFKDSGNEKYTKFYAKSSKAMSGGGSNSEEVKVVQSSDIESAKNKLLADLTDSIKKKIKEAVGEEYEIPEEAFNLGNVEYKTSNSSGEASQNFSVSLSTKASALAVKKQDLRDILGNIIIQKSGAKDIIKSSLAFEFGKTDTDFNSNTILMRLHTTAKTASDLDLDELKAGILGKSEDRAGEFLANYPDIEKFSVEYWPSFISGKIPAYGKRVEIKLDNN